MSDIEQIELSIEQAKALVRRKTMAEKLASNREFKKLILEGYLVDEASRLAGISGDSRMEPQRADILLGLQAISKFRIFMSDAIRMGEIAERELRDQIETLEDIRAEDDAMTTESDDDSDEDDI